MGSSVNSWFGVATSQVCVVAKSEQESDVTKDFEDRQELLIPGTCCQEGPL